MDVRAEIITTLLKLESLYMYNNKLTGQVPNGIANLNNLVNFHIGQNQLIGYVSDELKSKFDESGYSYENNLFENMPNQKQLTFKE